MARGNPGREIYDDDPDRKRRLATLGEACAKTGWRIYAWADEISNAECGVRNYHGLLENALCQHMAVGRRWVSERLKKWVMSRG